MSNGRFELIVQGRFRGWRDAQAGVSRSGTPPRRLRPEPKGDQYPGPQHRDQPTGQRGGCRKPWRPRTKENPMRSVIQSVGLALAIAVVLAPLAEAQTTSGSISGTVQDAQGAAVPRARVTATSASRGDVTTAETDDEGRFVFPQLQPGRYNLRVELQGFKTVEKTGVVLAANDKISAGVIRLELGTVTEA